MKVGNQLELDLKTCCNPIRIGPFPPSTVVASPALLSPSPLEELLRTLRVFWCAETRSFCFDWGGEENALLMPFEYSGVIDPHNALNIMYFPICGNRSHINTNSSVVGS